MVVYVYSVLLYSILHPILLGYSSRFDHKRIDSAGSLHIAICI